MNRYVIICGQVYRWEEKAPFTRSGKSILGGLEYDRENETLKCHECGRWYKSLGTHIGRSHGDSREYKALHGLRLSTGLIAPSLKAKFMAHPFQVGNNPGGVKFASVDSRRMGARRREERWNMAGHCPAQTITRLQVIAAEVGRPLRYKDIPPALLTACVRRHGSWPKALAAAGLPTEKEDWSTEARAHQGYPYDREALVEMLRDFYVLNKRVPTTRDFGRGRMPAVNTYKVRFGSLAAAHEAAGLGLVYRQKMEQRAGTALYIPRAENQPNAVTSPE